METGTAERDKSEAWDRLERLLGKARDIGSGEDLTEPEAMRLAVQTVRDVRRGVL